MFATASRKAKVDVLSNRSTFLNLLAQQRTDTAVDWVKTGCHKNQAEGAKTNEKTPKTYPLKGGDTKGNQPKKGKGAKTRMEGTPTNPVLVLRPHQLITR